jgi:hypothetical protein
MRSSPDATGSLQAALDAFEKKYVPVSMLPGRKVPAEKWTKWQSEEPTRASIYERWGGTRNGVALLCRDLVVFDVDDENKLDFVLESCNLKDAPICRTPRGGFHVHARARKGVTLAKVIRVRGQAIDLLTRSNLSIIPPSVNAAGVPYAWLGEGLRPFSELPLARIGWTRERQRTRIRPTIEIAEGEVMVRRARGYLACIEGAISGQRGHDRTFRVACKLLHLPPKGFGLSIEQAWPLLLEWNEQCEPPWSERELLHKLQDALKKRQ